MQIENCKLQTAKLSQHSPGSYNFQFAIFNLQFAIPSLIQRWIPLRVLLRGTRCRPPALCRTSPIPSHSKRDGSQCTDRETLAPTTPHQSLCFWDSSDCPGHHDKL